VRQSLLRAVRSVWVSEHEETGIPTPTWIFLLWVGISTVFYVVDRMYVQTRYVMIMGPGLLVVIIAGIMMLSRSAARAVYVVTLMHALLMSVFIARPFVRNKGRNCEVTGDLAKFIRHHLPPGTPIATYSIGEIAFLSQYPIVDTGGITRPEALAYVNDNPIVQAHWAQTVGAQYFIGIKPQEHSMLMYRRPTWDVSWSLHPSHYEKTELLELWTLGPDD
jgi:hypothetical protein